MSATKKIVIGLVLLFGAIGLDYLGSSLESLSILVISMILAIAGALVGLRGMIEFLSERLQ